MPTLETGRAAVRCALWALAAFPLTLLAAASLALLLGGRCAPWQALAGLVAALGALWVAAGGRWRYALWGGVLFGGYLAFVWVATGCFVVNDYDSAGYHLPTVRLLMGGWNPIRTATPEALAAFAGLDLATLWHWHVLFIVRPVETVSAVLGFYACAPFNLLFPCYALLVPVSLAAVWRWLRGFGWRRPVRALAWGLMLCEGGLVCLRGGVVDGVVFLSATALLAAMLRYLSTRAGLGEMLLFSCWMMTSKQLGLLTCFVFWCCFAAVFLWQTRAQFWRSCLRLGAWGLLLTSALCFICFAPYFTSARTYGHPLYPAYSGDSVRFPTYDITGDFRDRNADAQQMGHLGLFANAFLSARLTQRFYAWRLNQSDFRPRCRVWWQDDPRREACGSPLSSLPRVLYLTAFLLLCCAPNRDLRRLAWFALAGLFCMPTPYLGYVRYTPWIAALPILACAQSLQRLGARRLGLCGLWGVAATALAAESARLLFPLCVAIESQDELARILQTPGITAWVGTPGNTTANLQLLVRQTPRYAACEVLRAEEVPSQPYALTLLHVAVMPKPGAAPTPTRYAVARQISARSQRYKAYLRLVPHVLCRVLPRVLLRRCALRARG